MGRRKSGQRVDGWLILDKPPGISSARAVALTQRLLDAAKAGHGGTLDPLASGVLPIAFGEATKTVQWVMLGRKRYRFALRFGEARDTDDAEGTVVATSSVRPNRAGLEAVLPRFTGRISQMPPRYSALKVGGQRAYALARAGAELELAPRMVQVDRLAMLGWLDPDTADLEVDCGKGTYIRSLGRDIAQVLGSVGYIAALRRTACGPFDEKDAIPLDKLESLGYHPGLLGHLLPVATALDDIPALALTEPQARRLQGGQAVAVSEVDPTCTGIHAVSSSAHAVSGAPSPSNAAVVRAMAGDRLVAIARIEASEIRPVRVFNWT
jgi:tRNA pseudouridine55 synthase